MTKQGVEAVAADSREALALGESLTEAEWMTDSDCAGWRVKDVFAHLSSVFRQVADPTSAVEGATDDTEANQELWVAQRKDWPPAQVLDEYREWSEKGIAALAGTPGAADGRDRHPAQRPRQPSRSTCSPTRSPSTTTAISATTSSPRTARSNVRRFPRTTCVSGRRSSGCSRGCRRCVRRISRASSMRRSTSFSAAPAEASTSSAAVE